METLVTDKLIIDPSDELARNRIVSMLASAIGKYTSGLLLDPEVIEIMLNDDGKLWVDKLTTGMSFTGQYLSPTNAERVIYIVASSVKAICNQTNPLLSADVPGIGVRFQGVLPPISRAPIFCIRKKAVKIFTLTEYVSSGVVTPQQAAFLRRAVLKKKNIVIVGGTGSGKTTLTNALLSEIATTTDRLLIIEDTSELQCDAENKSHLNVKDGIASMTELVKATLRMRPTRIIIGEVRGPEAHVFLKACNTGHPGGCTTVHADSARKALSRFEQLVLEAGISQSRDLIGQAINHIVYIEKTAVGRQVTDILDVSLGNDGNYVISNSLES